MAKRNRVSIFPSGARGVKLNVLCSIRNEKPSALVKEAVDYYLEANKGVILSNIKNKTS